MKRLVFGMLVVALCLGNVSYAFSQSWTYILSKGEALEIQSVKPVDSKGYGRTFQPGQEIDIAIHGVYSIDCDNGWAVGDEGIILHTTDGGTSWIPQTSGTTNTLKALNTTLYDGAMNIWAVLESSDSDFSIPFENLRGIHTNQKKDILIIRGRIPKTIPEGDYYIIVDIPVADKDGQEMILRGKSKFTISIGTIIEGIISGTIAGVFASIIFSVFLHFHRRE